MTDQTSDGYLNQDEPDEVADGLADDPVGLVDDPIIDEGAAARLREFLRTPQGPVPGAPIPPTPTPVSVGAPVPARTRAQEEVPSIAEFLSSSGSSTVALERELAELKHQLVLLRMTPQERYPETLGEAGVSLEHAREILDRVIIQLEPWQEEIQVVRGLTVKLQSRGHFDVRRLDKWAEETRPQLDTTVQAEALMNNMASSLVKYGVKFELSEDEKPAEGYKRAYDFIEALPYPASRLLQRTLATFDAKMNAVFSDGFLENF